MNLYNYLILGHRDRWQWLLFFNVVPVLFNLFLYKCPDSPVYILVQTKDLTKAREGKMLDSMQSIVFQKHYDILLKKYLSILSFMCPCKNN